MDCLRTDFRTTVAKTGDPEDYGCQSIVYRRVATGHFARTAGTLVLCLDQ